MRFLEKTGPVKVLVNILFGLYKADQGEVRISGEKVEMNSPHDAINNKIGMVHQHFQLVPVLSVTENIVLVTNRQAKGALDFEKPQKSQNSANVTASKLTREQSLKIFHRLSTKS